MILDTIKQSLQPASMTVVVILLAIGVSLLYAPARIARQGRRCLAALVLAYWTLSCSAGAALLARTLIGGYRPLESAADAPGAQAVVMLGGGSKTVQASGGRVQIMTYPTVLRALETARVYHLLGDPLVIISGGITEANAPFGLPESEAVKTAVVALGVPADRVVLESESRNTREEAVTLKRILAQRGIDRFVMVTSPLHMRRSLAVFAAEGLHPVPSAAALYGDRTQAPFPLLPTDTSLEIGNAVVYEWSATAYYWWRGWL